MAVGLPDKGTHSLVRGAKPPSSGARTQPSLSSPPQQHCPSPLPPSLPSNPTKSPGRAQSLDTDPRVRGSCRLWGQKSRSEGLFGTLPEAGGSSERPESRRVSSQARQHRLPSRLDLADGTALLTVGAVLPLTPLPAVPHRASQGRAGPVTCQLHIPLRPTALVPGGSEWGPG